MLIDSLPLSPRVALFPGDKFRTIKGSGPKYAGKYPLGPYGVFRLHELDARRTRIYAEATDVKTGQRHTLYVSGPKYRKGDTLFIPFKIRKVK